MSSLPAAVPLSIEEIAQRILIVRGREFCVSTPAHEIVYLALKPYMHGTPAPLI